MSGPRELALSLLVFADVCPAAVAARVSLTGYIQWVGRRGFLIDEGFRFDEPFGSSGSTPLSARVRVNLRGDGGGAVVIMSVGEMTSGICGCDRIFFWVPSAESMLPVREFFFSWC